ncbi:hypothetical protein JW905_17725 [bacterium]|nr:hypothetical protein [candidate division CSSED10-310 bacterium]
MKAMRWISLALIPLLACGCFELYEEIWVNEDGSGRFKLDMGFSEILLNMAREEGRDDPLQELRENYEATKADLESNPNIARFDYEEYKLGNMRHFVFDIDVRDISVVDDLHRQIVTERDKGKLRPEGRSELTIDRLENGNLQFHQVFGNPEKDPYAPENPFAEALGASFMQTMLGNRYIIVKLHGPRILSCNGTLDATMQTVEWRIPLLQLIGEGQAREELRAEVEMPRQINWLLMAGIVAGVVVLVAATVLIVRR